MTALSESARGVLRDAAGKLRRATHVDKSRGAAVEEIVAWCRAWDIEPGSRLTRARLRLDRALLDAIDTELEVQGEAPLAVGLGGLTSGEQAAHGYREVKGVRAAPRASRVLIGLPPGAPRPGLAGEAREYRDVDCRTLVLSAFEVLVQVENLDSFYAFSPEMPALADHRRPLVAYRGDHHYGGGFARLAEAWAATGRPHCYAGDFDAKGVSIALASGATHLLLPPLDDLAARAATAHLPPEQQAYQPALREHADRLPAGHPLADYLALLLGEQRGLRQQWLGERLRAVPLAPAR